MLVKGIGWECKGRPGSSPGSFLPPGKGAALFLAVLLSMLLLMPEALACSGCEVNYPFLHSYPGDEELTQAKDNFVKAYSAVMLEKYRGIKLGEIWHIKLERPGIEEQYDTVEVILCFREELDDAGVVRTSYHYTMLSYDQERGFFFWPHSMGSFPERQLLDAFIDEYVIGGLMDQQVVYRPGPESPQQQGEARGNRGILPILIVLLGLTFLFFTLRGRIGKRI